MSFAAGDRLGPYEILSSIGQGGMGEVFKARDTRLNRIVAIKVSQAEFSDRFQREANAIAALNHPNICTLYDVGPNYLVMEFVEGSSPQGPMPSERALSLAIQLAQALEAAHRKGVIHRDLKPANILVTKSGLKVLDFGLAKLDEPGFGPDAKTAVKALSGEGTIAGTLQYMAPEQLQGAKVDQRADLFAFGCVLYELLTGKMAFDGANAASVITAIMSQQPPLVSTLQPLTPKALDRIVQRCLAKETEDRWQSARDLRDALESLGASAETTPATVVKPAPAARLPWLLAAGLAVACAALGWLAIRPSTSPPPEMRVDLVTPPSTHDFSLSPDGRKLAFIANHEGASRLWVRQIDSGVSKPITGTDGAMLPFWSPDSRNVGFYADLLVKRVGLDDRSPQTVGQGNMVRAAGVWGQNGLILFTRGARVARIPESGGLEHQGVTPLAKGQTEHRASRFLPDGKRFLLFVAGDEQGIYVGSLDKTPPRLLTPADSAGDYLPNGWLLYVEGDALVARKFDSERASLSGDAITIGKPVPAYLRQNSFSIAWDTGAIAYRTGNTPRRQLIWMNRAGERIGVASEPDDQVMTNPRISPDGRRIAVGRGEGKKRDIWIFENGRPTRFTFHATSAINYPVWSPDSRNLIYSSGEHVLLKPADGSAPEMPLGTGINRVRSWSPDGRTLLAWRGQNAGDLLTMPSDGSQPPVAFVATPASENGGAFSPDGKWIAYHSNESGRPEVYIRPYPGPGGVWQVSTNRATFPRWRADGKELYFIGPDRKLMAASIAVQGTTIVPGKPEPLFTLSLDQDNYDVARDGRFLVNTEFEDPNPAPITLLLNWRPPK